MKEAAFYTRTQNNFIRCSLCPHECTLHPDERGKCLVRVNRKGVLYAENYGLVSALHFDPIEKKPLYHFYPGSRILSIGTVGCNLSCGFCQNSDISQKSAEEFGRLVSYRPESLVGMASADDGNIGIAYTYNEPAIFFEFVMETAAIISAAGLKNVMVTNGFIETDPLREMLPLIDAFNVDLKSFSNEFYRDHTGGRLKPVLRSLETISGNGRHLELTNLIIPGLNDDPVVFEDMVCWIHDHLGTGTVLHLSKYFPSFHYKIPSTPDKTMFALFDIARKHLQFAYLGNMRSGLGNDTLCPHCGNLLVTRDGYDIKTPGLLTGPYCKTCRSDLRDFIIF